MKKNKTKLVKFTREEWEYIIKCADESRMKVGTYIQTMAGHGQVIKYNLNDNTIKRGTHIAFRKDGYGQSFLRSKTLGIDYDEEHIKERIEQVNKNRKSEVIESLSNAYSDNIVSLEELKKKQSELAIKMGNLNKKTAYYYVGS